MSVANEDIEFRKSEIVTDTGANGGRIGSVVIISGVRHMLFPRVTKAERTAGVTRWRKHGLCNRNAANDIAYGALMFIEKPSNAADRFYLGKATENRDTQADLADYSPALLGAGQLNTALTGGESAVAIVMENDDFEFLNGGFLHISNKFKTAQTIDSGVNIGDSVQWDSENSKWIKISPTTDIDYPLGLYVGSSTVMTIENGTKEEYLAIAENLYEDEDIGDGDGADTSPDLTALTHATNGICRQPGKLPVITATCGAQTRTVNIAADGTCSGYCSAGELDMATGEWTTPIAFTTAPDDDTDITITYRENAFSYAGNVVTVELSDQVANAYLTANTYAGGCIYLDEIKPDFSDWVETSAQGTYDEATYPPILDNKGTVDDDFTITFTSATAFTCSGIKSGAIGTGVITEDFAPVNPDTATPYFTIDKDGWGGTWANGNTVDLTTAMSAFRAWLKELVPPNTAQEPHNLVVIGWYLE